MCHAVEIGISEHNTSKTQFKKIEVLPGSSMTRPGPDQYMPPILEPTSSPPTFSAYLPAAKAISGAWGTPASWGRSHAWAFPSPGLGVGHPLSSQAGAQSRAPIMLAGLYSWMGAFTSLPPSGDTGLCPGTCMIGATPHRFHWSPSPDCMSLRGATFS